MIGARAAGLLLAGVLGVEACSLDDISVGGAGGAGGSFPAATSSTTTSVSTTSSTSVSTSATSSTSTGMGGEGGQPLAEICGDGADNDGDGQVDCADLDCTSVCQDSCDPVTVLDGPVTVTGDNTGAPSLRVTSCAGESGPEVLYALVAPFDGILEAQLYSEPDLGISVRTNCPDDGSEINCADAVTQRSTEILVTPVNGGQTYFVMVDAYTPGEVGPYALSVGFQTSPGESICDDLIDNDGDGLTDCEDAFNCRAFTTCTTGAAPTGAPCFAASECAARGGEPVCINEARFGYPQGYCSEFCTLAADDCGGEARCSDPPMPLPSGRGLCYRRCAVRADCPAEYACAEVGMGSPICVPEERCDDGADNDGDGATDCADSGCAGFLACVCSAAAPIPLGTTTGDTTAGTMAIRGSCNRDGDAPEDLYTFTPPVTGTLTITLFSATDQGIYVFGDCREPSSELACADLVVGGLPEMLRLDVVAGAPVSVVVDGRSGPADAGPYELTLTLE